jgi:hypothetical protein
MASKATMSSHVSHTELIISQEKIAMRAYEKWLKRGQLHGSDIQDWLEAEAELRAESKKTTSNRR